ncbi:MAG: envelope stress response membrane protein PspC [Gammaproteobacteria bacterium]
MRRRHRDDHRRSSRNRLLRDSENAVLFGVCAGLADYFGFDLKLTRIAVALGGFFFFPTVPIIYVILGLLLDEAPGAPKAEERRREDPDLRRRVRSEPHDTLRSVRYRYRELDRRLQRLEKYVTSKKFNLQREIDGLRD